MISKREIVSRELTGEELEFFDGHFGNLFDCMEEYADAKSKEVAIEFAMFCGSNSLSFNSQENKWTFFDTTGRYNLTTEELFNLYLQNKNK